MDLFLQLGLGNAIAATGLALAAVVAARIVRRPALVHALWLLVLLKLLTPPLWPVAFTWPQAPLPPSSEAVEAIALTVPPSQPLGRLPEGIASGEVPEAVQPWQVP